MRFFRLTTATCALGVLIAFSPLPQADARATTAAHRDPSCVSEHAYDSLELGMTRHHVFDIIGGKGRGIRRGRDVQVRRFPICHAPRSPVRLKFHYGSNWRLMHKYAAAQKTTDPLSSGRTLTVRLRAAIKRLAVHHHRHAASYDRDRDFGDWITQYGECDTRAVVLKTESLKPTTQNRYCTIKKGKWYSYYNARYYRHAYGGAVQIDHTVPVENAWISGAWRWTKPTRVRYYNDLGDPRTLVAVDEHDNEVKSDQDPTTWMPADGKCRYIGYWVAVKLRWSLSATSAEQAKLAQVAATCPNKVLHIHRTVIHRRG